ncbi:MAG: luciferase [marine actinobacterium MedAcidi-G2B]|nr:MAG: luciferase [marine actinobacterium MedAcidi-G2B]MDC0245213.1 LLM class F420-dependent oxidoreductase [Acidimicrobiaceae bacterium]|tara:strand:- start:2158 stop:3120 length:963 start_codon:yes stop_codon:yes gene_type:complete
MSPYGLTIPLPGPLHGQQNFYRELVDLGYTDVWSAESNGAEGMIPLALAAAWAPELRLGTAILPAYTRSPALMAQTAATMADAAPGRVAFGIGSSSNVIVENWNGIPFEEPYKRVRDTVRFLKDALTGEKVTQEYDSFNIKGFRLGIVPEQPPKLLVAALREGMLRLAGREADGAIVNWLSPEDVRTVAGIVNEQGDDREVVARIFVCPSEDREAVIAGGRYTLAAYLNVPVYKAFHQWLGRSDLLGAHWERWDAGDRQGALGEIPESVVDELIVHGSPDQCRARISQYMENGITTPALAVMPFGGIDPIEAIRSLAPSK